MGELILRLSDPDFGTLERLGMAGIALSIDAAVEEKHDLSPLTWEVASDTIHLQWSDEVTDRDALLKLVEWAWQTRGPSHADGGLGVLYLPGIHRGTPRDDETQRIVENSGILSTFLQHPRVQPKTKPASVNVHLDADRQVAFRFVEAKRSLRYVTDAGAKLFDRKGRLLERPRPFSSYLVPGATSRHAGEESWEGPTHSAFSLLFAPIAAVYLQVRGSQWVVVLPDPTSLIAYTRVRKRSAWRPEQARAGDLADAGLRVLAAFKYGPKAVRHERIQEAPLHCTVIRVGKVAWNRQQVRSGAVRCRPASEALDAYRVVYRHLDNRIVARKDGEGYFVTVPTPRAAIARNILAGSWWYRDLFEIPPEDRKSVDDERKRRPADRRKSAERIWFEKITWFRDELRRIMDEIQEEHSVDMTFMNAFHLALRNHYGREAGAAARGSRSPSDRMQDFRDALRRKLTGAQTRTLLRAVIADYFSTSGSNEVLRQHGPEIWHFVDHPREWRRARDLALLSLATYRGKHAEDVEPDPATEAVAEEES